MTYAVSRRNTGAGGPGAADQDLRPRLLALLILVAGIVMIGHPGSALIALAAMAGLTLIIRVPLRQVMHRMRHVEGFLLVLLVILPFSMAGEDLFRIGPFPASVEGLERAVLIAVKVNATALALLALLGGAAPERLGPALLALHVPKGFVLLLDLVHRHSHTARDGFRRQSEAMRARGFRARSNLHSWRSLGHLIGGGLLRALERAERVEEAMRLRRGDADRLPGRPEAAPLRATALALPFVAAVLSASLILVDRLTG